MKTRTVVDVSCPTCRVTARLYAAELCLGAHCRHCRQPFPEAERVRAREALLADIRAARPGYGRAA